MIVMVATISINSIIKTPTVMMVIRKHDSDRASSNSQLHVFRSVV